MAFDTVAGTTVTAYFSSREQAQNAIQELKSEGFTQTQISLVVRPELDTTTSSDLQTTQTTGDKGRGVWDKVVDFFEGEDHNSANQHGANSTGANAYETTSARRGSYDYDRNEFQGSLHQMNMPEEHANYFTDRFHEGHEGALVTVRSEDRIAEATEILENNKGDVGKDTASFNRTPRTSQDTGVAATQRVQLLGEILNVHKERVQRGEVILTKQVISETKTIEVPVQREELVITRKAADGQRSAEGVIGDQDEIRIPLSEEQVNVSKQNVVLEEVSVGKRQVTDTKTVSDQVRHEELRVNEEGDVKRENNY